MSLTNEQINAQNFKDFYDQIFPYLNQKSFVGGFNKSELYSADEQIVGRYKNGKPLYQKTIELTNPALGSRISMHDYIPDEADFVLIKDCYAIRSSDIVSQFYNSSSDFFQCYFNKYYSYWDLIVRSNDAISTLVVTCKYTKASDSTINISDGNTYELNKDIIVGTWVDGRNVYQRTMFLAGQSSANQDYNYEISDLACELIWLESAMFTRYGSTDEKGSLITRGVNMCYVGYSNGKNYFRLKSTNYTYPLNDLYITFRYVK